MLPSGTQFQGLQYFSSLHIKTGLLHLHHESNLMKVKRVEGHKKLVNDNLAWWHGKLFKMSGNDGMESS